MPPQLLINRILFGTDFSAGAIVALPYAVSIARRFGSKLYLAHVIPSDAYTLIPVHERDTALATMREHAGEQMTALRPMSLLNTVAHEVLIDHGDVQPILSEMADRYGVDLLVIGTHGRRGFEKLLLGSVAEEILRLAQKPVLMVGPQSSPPHSDADIEFRQILHATDFSPESEPAMRYAYSLAKTYGASLALLHVAEDVWREPLSTRMSAADFFQERLLERHWAMNQEGVAPAYYVEFGARADQILEAAGRLRSELIVMGVRGARYPRVAAHLPGPTAYDVVSNARCPVLVLRGHNG